MSVPLVPNKSRYSPLPDNRNGVKNDHESSTRLGDRNANPIMAQVTTRDREAACRDPVRAISNASTGGSETFPRFGRETRPPHGFGRAFHVGPVSLKEPRLPPASHPAAEEAGEARKAPRRFQGSSQWGLRSCGDESRPEGPSLRRDEFFRRISQKEAAQAPDSEARKRHSLERSSNFFPKTGAVAKEHVAAVTHRRLLSASLDSIEKARHFVGGMEPSQALPPTPPLGPDPADRTPEALSSTSAAAEIPPPDSQGIGRRSPRTAPLDAPWGPTTMVDLSDQPGQAETGVGAELNEARTEHSDPREPETRTVVPIAGDGGPGEGETWEQRGLAGEEETAEGKAPQCPDPIRGTVCPTLGQVKACSGDPVSGGSLSAPTPRAGRKEENGSAGQSDAQSTEAWEPSPVSPLTMGHRENGPSTQGTPTSKQQSSETGPCGFPAGGQPATPRQAHPTGHEPREGDGMSGAGAVESPPAASRGELCNNVPGLEREVASHMEESGKEEAGESYLPGRMGGPEIPPSGTGSGGEGDPEPHPPGIALNSCKLQPSTPADSSNGLPSLPVEAVGSTAPLPTPDGVSGENGAPKAPGKTVGPSGIPKPILALAKGPLPAQGEGDGVGDERPEEKAEAKPLLVPKPKHVRPKIITYVRRSPPALCPPAPAPRGLPLPKESKAFGPDLPPTPSLYDKLKPDLQKPRLFSSGLVLSGIRPPAHHFSQMSEKFLQEVAERTGKEEFCSPAYAHYEVPPSLYRSAMLLKPQLGLGAMSRLPPAKNRILTAGQRPPGTSIHPQGPIANATSLYHSDPSAELKKGASSSVARSNLLKSGLRPPGYSRLPAAKLAAFGFVRSSSVSSVSSNQSSDGLPNDPGKLANGAAFGNEEQPTPRTTGPPREVVKGVGRPPPPGPCNPPPSRRSLLPAPKTTVIPAGLKKEAQKDPEASKPAGSSPKRFATPSPKLHSPGHPKARSAAPRDGSPAPPDVQAREAERQLVQRLQDRCAEQYRRLSRVQGELRRAVRGFEVFAVSTQHFFGKNQSALEKERELSAQLANIRDEVASNGARCEALQREKEELERRFEEEVRRLRRQQQAELQELEGALRGRFAADTDRLRQDHLRHLDGVKGQHHEQVKRLSATHEAALLEMEAGHADAMAALQEDHQHRVGELMSAHELEKKELEDSFEKLRLSLQDQVDTLTFQSQALRARARRFEEALRKTTEEQLEVALAPYQHLEEDMNSLKQVLEMKNQQIHKQEKKIVQLEKLAEKNIVLEEKIQILQQQNEDLKARIDQNTVVTRQLSEENANLQEHVEKETEEKKRLSRTNEELLWKLQTGDPASPVRLSPTSPVRRTPPGPPSPARASGAAPR
ncbi:microtubule-associated tumor suppressor candidate 2 [Tachyglossus aculeatus]|uniref:microtubule-associated tumor suppressor candidate 2 n=1 Tax=Tachyglossus aculeatus TaxID=9261 RepID=UPI0018F2C588|nr:microtubule-associated tumor suppressor candidate 2 [Tachyglossus aculeatus]